jgi:hypothetical protein
VDRVKQIPKHQRILYWHHCLKYITGYLVFNPL